MKAESICNTRTYQDIKRYVSSVDSFEDIEEEKIAYGKLKSGCQDTYDRYYGIACKVAFKFAWRESHYLVSSNEENLLDVFMGFCEYIPNIIEVHDSKKGKFFSFCYGSFKYTSYRIKQELIIGITAKKYRQEFNIIPYDELAIEKEDDFITYGKLAPFACLFNNVTAATIMMDKEKLLKTDVTIKEIKESLTKKEWNCAEDKWLNGLTTSEIADKHNISFASVKGSLKRVKQKYKKNKRYKQPITKDKDLCSICQRQPKVSYSKSYCQQCMNMKGIKYRKNNRMKMVAK